MDEWLQRPDYPEEQGLGAPFQVDLQALRGTASERPTLFLGVGGTGFQVVNEVKKRLQAAYPTASGAFQYLVLDLEPHDQPGVLEANSEVVYLGDVDAATYLTTPEWEQFVRPWWPAGYVPPRLTEGAKQVRCCGRLGLFYTFNGHEVSLPMIWK